MTGMIATRGIPLENDSPQSFLATAQPQSNPNFPPAPSEPSLPCPHPTLHPCALSHPTLSALLTTTTTTTTTTPSQFPFAFRQCQLAPAQPNRTSSASCPLPFWMSPHRSPSLSIPPSLSAALLTSYLSTCSPFERGIILLRTLFLAS